MLALWVLAGQAFERYQVLDQAARLISAWIVLKELLPGVELVPDTAYQMRTVNRAIYFTAVTNHID